MDVINPKALYTKAPNAEAMAMGLLKLMKAWDGVNTFSITINTNVDGLSLVVDGVSQAIEAMPAYKEFLDNTKDRRSISCVSAIIQRRPSGQNNQHFQQQTINYLTKDCVVGEFSLSLQRATKEIPKILDAIEDIFKVTSYVDLVGELSQAVDTSAIQMRERSVADLEKQVSKMADFLTDMTRREAENRESLKNELEKTFQERRDKLEEEYRSRRDELDELRSDQENEHGLKTKDLETREAAFNLKDEQGVRRDLLLEINKVLKDAEVHNASVETQSKRRIIHWIVWGVFALSLAIAFLSIWKLFFSGAVNDWHYWVIFASSIATIITTAIYYLKWNDRWFREHANAEFAAKRYKADILRASWLAELAGEWKKTKEDVGLSPQLIEAFGHNLFVDVSSTSPNEHPMDEMADLIKRATEVSMGKSGFKIRGIKKNKSSE